MPENPKTHLQPYNFLFQWGKAPRQSAWLGGVPPVSLAFP